ncbi:MAG TPA: XRE family transcriptional regulator [Burkholderiaceae bacterium]|nr:XRE family transcriptional regulator [Burkholderiaceae bacterium]
MRTPATPSPAAEPPRVGAMLGALRQQHGLSLDELSRRAGVSKSMLSQIERGQANPTVAVVWRLASALDVPLAELLGESRPSEPLLATVPAHATPLMRSPDGKCELRILGPIDLAGRFEWYALTVQPGGTLDSQPHEPGSREHLTVQAGALEVTAGGESARLRHGETARYAVDVPHRIHNPGRTPAQALLVVLHPA